MRLIIAAGSLLFTCHVSVFAQSFKALDDGNSKLDRIENIEGHLKSNNNRMMQVDNILLAQKTVIERLQQKIDDLVKKHLDQEKISALTNQGQEQMKEVFLRLQALEGKVKQLQNEHMGEIKDRLKIVEESLQNLIKAVEDKK